MALRELIGKQAGLPVYAVVGGNFRDRVPVYLDRSGPTDVSNLDEWRRLASETVASGYTKFKFDIDYIAPDLVSDVWSRSIGREQMISLAKRLGAARDAAGDEAEISVDCHMHYDLVSSIELSKMLDSIGISWLEDPIPVMDLGALAEIREKSAVPICAGEMYTFDLAKLAINLKAVDILHPDILFAGGLHETKKCVNLLMQMGCRLLSTIILQPWDLLLPHTWELQ